MRTRNIFWLLAWLIAALALGGGTAAPTAAGEQSAVTITSPSYDSVHVLGDGIVFACNVKGPGGGDLPNVKLTWTSQLDGKIGEGALLKISTLTVGVHRITVEAYNEAGTALGTASIKLKISQSKGADDGTPSGSAPIGVGKNEPYVVNPFN
jgi:hypothetical protein